MKKTSVLLFAIILLMAGVWQVKQYLAPSVEIDPEISDQIYASPTLPQGEVELPTISIEASESGQTAFDLLQAVVPVAYKDYDFGVFIESIDGLASDEEHYWALYVNDEYAEAGVDQTTLEEGDIVEFRYEKLEASPY